MKSSAFPKEKILKHRIKTDRIREYYMEKIILYMYRNDELKT